MFFYVDVALLCDCEAPRFQMNLKLEENLRVCVLQTVAEISWHVSTVSVSLTSLPADEGDEEFSDDQLLRLPPVGPPSWDSNVVCIQPTRNHSRPEGHEESEEKQNNNNVSLPDCTVCILSHVQLHTHERLLLLLCIFFFWTAKVASPPNMVVLDWLHSRVLEFPHWSMGIC